MTQTFLRLAPVGLWSRIGSFFSRRTRLDTPAHKQSSQQQAERDRLPERDESFYWGFCTFGHW